MICFKPKNILKFFLFLPVTCGIGFLIAVFAFLYVIADSFFMGPDSTMRNFLRAVRE